MIFSTIQGYNIIMLLLGYWTLYYCLYTMEGYRKQAIVARSLCCKYNALQRTTNNKIQTLQYIISYTITSIQSQVLQRSLWHYYRTSHNRVVGCKSATGQYVMMTCHMHHSINYTVQCWIVCDIFELRNAGSFLLSPKLRYSRAHNSLNPAFT